MIRLNKLLFICTGNYYRSRFAEIYFRDRAKVLGLNWSADSRGLGLTSANVGPLSQFTIEHCEQIGVDYSPQRDPRALELSDLQTATRTIALKEIEHRPMMQMQFPDWVDRIEYWQVHDIDCAPPSEALPQISRRVDELIAQLRQQP